MKVLISIPAYNEEKTIGKVLSSIHTVMKKVNLSYEIVVVNDGSTDKTAKVAKEHRAKVYSHVTNRGLASTFRTEMKIALEKNPEIIVHTDADGQYRAEEIPKLIKPIIDKKADLVLGSRFRGKIESMPLIKRWGNKAFSNVVSHISRQKISDAQTGFRAFILPVAREIKTISNFTYTQEQIIKAAQSQFRIIEVPIAFDRRGGNTKSRLMKGPFEFAVKAGVNLLRIYRDYDPIKFFGIFGSFFLGVGVALGIWISISVLLTGTAGGIPRVILSVLFLITGIQIIIFGFLADMVKERTQ